MQAIKPKLRCAVCAGPLPRIVHDHYGAMNTCVSCAAFFRRSVCTGKKYACERPYKCVMFRNSIRSACRSCRLAKCYEIGMIEKLVPSKRIHQMRQQISENAELLAHLLRVEDKFSRNFNAVIDFPAEIWDKIYAMNSFKELISTTKHWDLFGMMANQKVLHRRICLEDLADLNFGDRFLAPCSDKPWKIPDFTRDVVLFVKLAKTMPVVGKLELDDQLLLLCHICVPVLRFCRHFYSAQQNADVMMLPDDVPNFQYQVQKYGHDPRARKLAELDVVKSVQPFKNLSLTKSEMVTLRAVMLSHMMTTGLSMHAQRLLQAEAERISHLLLQQLQQRLGTLPGARAYMEALQLVQRSFCAAQAQYESIVYLEMFHEKGTMAAKAPRILETLGTLGSRG